MEGTSQAGLAMECPACPQPGKNLPEGWEKVDANIAFKYALFLAQDANFRKRNGMVSSDARDPTLGQGWAYFVNKPEYIEHVKKFVDSEEVSSSLISFGALNTNTLYRSVAVQASRRFSFGTSKT